MLVKQRRPSGLSTAIKNTLKKVKISDAVKPNYHVKLANTLEEKTDAFRLVYESYLDKGFITAGQKDLDLYTIDHDQEAETVIFNVYHESNLLAGTMTVAFDASRKIPSEILFSEELNHLRKTGQRLAEVTRLVVDKHFRNSSKVLELMIDLMMAYCYHNNKADTLICEVHPHHKKFYTKILGFKEISKERPCPLVGGSLAVALAMPLSVYAHSTKESNTPKYKYYKKFTPFREAQFLAKETAKQHAPLTEEELWEIGIGEVMLESI